MKKILTEAIIRITFVKIQAINVNSKVQVEDTVSNGLWERKKPTKNQYHLKKEWLPHLKVTTKFY